MIYKPTVPGTDQLYFLSDPHQSPLRPLTEVLFLWDGNHLLMEPADLPLEKSLLSRMKNAWWQQKQAGQNRLGSYSFGKKYYAYVYRPHGPQTVEIFSFGHRIYQIIAAALRDGYKVFDPQTPATFVVQTKLTAGFPNYDESHFLPSPDMLRSNLFQNHTEWIENLVQRAHWKNYPQVMQKICVDLGVEFLDVAAQRRQKLERILQPRAVSLLRDEIQEVMRYLPAGDLKLKLQGYL